MGSVVMVVAGVFGHEAFQMSLIENDDVVEQVPATTANKALGDAVLPGTAVAGPFGLDTEALDGADELLGARLCTPHPEPPNCSPKDPLAANSPANPAVKPPNRLTHCIH
jgi:hypothetical protein